MKKVVASAVLVLSISLSAAAQEKCVEGFFAKKQVIKVFCAKQVLFLMSHSCYATLLPLQIMVKIQVLVKPPQI